MKFKHKVTDWIAVSANSQRLWYYNLYNAQKEYQGQLSFFMVERGSDWIEITEPELGQWVIFERSKVGRIVELNSYNTTMLYDSYDFDTNVVIGKLLIPLSRVDREADTEEIEQALNAIRKHKGLVEGATAKFIPGDSRTNFEVTGNISYFGSYDGADRLIDDNGILYDNGVWAELDDNYEKMKPKYSDSQLQSIVSELSSYSFNNCGSLVTLDYKQGTADAVAYAIRLIQSLIPKNTKS